jgi:hypothetical protein
MQNQTPAGSAPRLLLKIINESRDAYDQPKVVDTPDGRQHVFMWSVALGCYVYEPPDQQAIEDIMRLNWEFLTLPWHFAPVHPDALGGAVVPAQPGAKAAPVASAHAMPPFVRADLYAGYPNEDLQALCRDCGFPMQGNAQDNDNLKRQLAAYFVGRSWAIEEKRRVEEQLVALRAERDTAVASLVARDAATTKTATENVATVVASAPVAEPPVARPQPSAPKNHAATTPRVKRKYVRHVPRPVAAQA